MAAVQVNGVAFETALIAFDKDGTLIDLHQLWGGKAKEWVDALLEMVGKDETTRLNLYHSLGYDPVVQKVIADSPLAFTSLPKLYTVAATVLFQQGLPWYEADRLVQMAANTTIAAPPHSRQISPIGDVQRTIHELAAAGIRIAIVTSDNRAPAEKALPLLGIEDAVDILLCGNDDLPGKPDPAGFHFLSKKYNIDRTQMMMVGDTTGDMLFGKNAGVACCVGISSGQDGRSSGPLYADIVVSSIDAIRLV